MTATQRRRIDVIHDMSSSGCGYPEMTSVSIVCDPLNTFLFLTHLYTVRIKETYEKVARSIKNPKMEFVEAHPTVRWKSQAVDFSTFLSPPIGGVSLRVEPTQSTTQMDMHQHDLFFCVEIRKIFGVGHGSLPEQLEDVLLTPNIS